MTFPKRNQFARTGWMSLLMVVVFVGLTMPAAEMRASREVAAAQPPVARDTRFGLNQSWEDPEAADAAGAGWSRMMFWWSAFQPDGPGDLNLFTYNQDSYIDEELRRGRELVGVMLNVPAWASIDGTSNGVPRNLQLSWDHPDNYWGQFVRMMAIHYRGRIDSWVIWNESDIPPQYSWNTWHGTQDEYIQLMRVAYMNIKAVSPQARVVMFGSPWWYDRGEWLSQVLAKLGSDPDARLNNNYFDVANLHMYSREHDIPHVIPWLREQLDANGMFKPIWIGETNAIPYDDPLWPEGKAGLRASMDEQASYLIEAFALYLALGVQRVGINRLVDGADFEAGGEPFGMMRNDGTTRPAYQAFQVIARYYSGVSEAVLTPEDPNGLMQVTLTKPGERITVLWSAKPQAVRATVEAISPVALLVNKRGEATPVEAADGHYTLELAPATANSNEFDPNDFVVGGDPILLVERADGNLDAAVRPLSVRPTPQR